MPSLPVVITGPRNTDSQNGGAENEDVLRRFFNPALTGPTWDNLLEAIEQSGLVPHWNNARALLDQAYLTSASGDYLLRRAGEVGVVPPPGVGMSDEVFRDLALTLSTRRLTQNALDQLLEACYGPDACRAVATTSLAEPFSLQDGDEVWLRVQESLDIIVKFRIHQFDRIAVATADEVAAAFNHNFSELSTPAYARVVNDPTGQLVSIFSSARGLAGSIRVVGGRGAVQLGLPTNVFPAAAAPFGTWNVGRSPDHGEYTRFSLLNPTSYDLQLLQAGDLAFVYGQEFDSSLFGAHEIKTVSVTYPGATLTQWFDVDLNVPTVQVGVAQVSANTISFRRPTLFTVANNPRRALATQSDGTVRLVLPATTQMVVRGDGEASYSPVATALVLSVAVRRQDGLVTATTTTNHGLAADDEVVVDGVSFLLATPSITAGVPSTTLGAPHV